MSGWIKLDRNIMSHWIYQDETKFKAWLTILMTVNHESKTILIGDNLLICRRGESLKSIENWAKDFGKKWDRNKVNRFFNLLRRSKMIVTKSEQVTTRLTVCNYESYQGVENKNEQQVNSSRTASEQSVNTNKNEKNDKNEKKERGARPTISDLEKFFQEKGLNGKSKEEATKFFNHYESVGWVIGSGNKKMKSWTHAASGWVTRMKNYQSASEPKRSAPPIFKSKRNK